MYSRVSCVFTTPLLLPSFLDMTCVCVQRLPVPTITKSITNRRLHLLPDTKTKNEMLVMVTLNVTLASISVVSDCAGVRGLRGYGCLFHVSDHEKKKIIV